MVRRIQAAADTVKRRYRETVAQLSPQQQQLLTGLLFFIKFTVLAAPFYLALHSGWPAEGVRSGFASASAAVLRTVGLTASADGTFITTSQLLVDVTRDSTGWKSVMAFTALVLATPRSWRSRLTAVGLGISLLLVANLLRITSMIYAVEVFGISYELLHLVLWRWGLTVVVLGLWVLWLSTPSSQVRTMVSRF